jgi:hypothetical protein
MENTEVKQSILNPLLKQRPLAFAFILIAVLLSMIENFYKIQFFIGAGHIVSYLLILLPLVYMIGAKSIVNPYTKWFIPFLLIMIGDMFYYNNEMTQFLLPIVFYVLAFILYMTSMHTVHHLHQVLFLANYKIGTFSYLRAFFQDLFVHNIDKKLYSRILTALFITVPFLVIFVILLTSADSHFSDFFQDLFRFNIPFESHYLLTLPLVFIVYLILFIFTLSNYKDRSQIKETKVLDLVIVGIFLGLINFLFFTFILMQIPFLSTGSIPQGMNVAHFAREGFFQLMMLMGLVSLIFLFILRRHKDEKITTILLIGLLLQSILIGFVSLKKMYLYQSLMGATVLRYYVEWFDYFLLFILALGIIFLLKRYKFSKMLDTVVVLGFVSFTLVASLNIDAIVAKHNIEKFKDQAHKLDKYALSRLSIDALPIIEEYNISINPRENYYTSWYLKRNTSCEDFASYHYGYCSRLPQ